MISCKNLARSVAPASAATDQQRTRQSADDRNGVRILVSSVLLGLLRRSVGDVSFVFSDVSMCWGTCAGVEHRVHFLMRVSLTASQFHKATVLSHSCAQTLATVNETQVNVRVCLRCWDVTD